MRGIPVSKTPGVALSTDHSWPAVESVKAAPPALRAYSTEGVLAAEAEVNEEAMQKEVSNKRSCIVI